MNISIPQDKLRALLDAVYYAHGARDDRSTLRYVYEANRLAGELDDFIDLQRSNQEAEENSK